MVRACGWLACWTTLVSTAFPPWPLTTISPAMFWRANDSMMSATIAASVVALMLIVPGVGGVFVGAAERDRRKLKHVVVLDN
ncbi:hypothetical protein LAUMK35_04089 [Mycobacterium pseudokansasii]|uniref:Uncharacterized protein n=1 Tax=Mycobacterium pseudokansasii TaxID=2341080 RepID=A0A498QWW2_9MYCO|nr:hypothetical protein LAUMK35_04089 [Mycobacterium pseudokansasii]VBA29805.1 hypothetical protein LAUMK21_04085 [Mycobacterium pseudokansasii]VBA53287.1 hypothetical protein LAUMK142_03972 [Mycobacterium pseudokansasii]